MDRRKIARFLARTAEASSTLMAHGFFVAPAVIDTPLQTSQEKGRPCGTPFVELTGRLS